MKEAARCKTSADETKQCASASSIGQPQPRGIKKIPNCQHYHKGVFRGNIFASLHDLDSIIIILVLVPVVIVSS